MTFPEWSLLVGSVLSIGLAVGPWMFKVHAKLAVIASKIVDLCEKLDRTQRRASPAVGSIAAGTSRGSTRTTCSCRTSPNGCDD